ncbi:formin-like protein 14 [Diachasma alloeum]|uniref:formin-like protein 14 n=1 Tax=Diachasma alloeum TaxID=454923 RepID=UPI000738512D|nr:formin-like protein 14 [Diachasma alloeum]
MSNSVDPLPRPKVRFTHSPEGSNSPGPFQGPRIREIVTLKHPVKLVPLPPAENPTPDPETVVPSLQKPPSNPKPSVPPPQPQVPPIKVKKKSPAVPSSSEDSRRPKKSSHDLEYLQKKLEELKTSDKPRQRIPSTSKDSKKPPDAKKNVKFTEKIPSKSILRSKNTPASQTRPGNPPGPDGKTENKENLNKKEPNSAEGKAVVKKSKIVQKRESVRSGVLSGPSAGAGGGKGGGCPRRGPTTAGGRDLGLMPCMKGRKVAETKRNEVNVLRHVARPIPRVFVGPGVPHDRGSGGEGPEEGQMRVDGATGDLLSRPEYNSIVCTIKKLEKVRKKKVVENFESLPGVYKDLVNGKISSALDFPAFESVYHDLVDISIDEKQLPMRLTRSRDPEPRPKDFIPNLSDFFVPQYPKEYSVAVKIRPRTPEIIDNWSGFSISDKINAWKMTLDEPSI